MKTALLKRVQRLEEVRGVACQPPEFQVGYVKNLPAAYTGDRHLVTVGRDPDDLSLGGAARSGAQGRQG
jgi:hypothetical protein